MPVAGIHPDLQEAAMALVIADIDYEENKGNSRLCPVYAQKAREAQERYRAKKAEIEARGETAVRS